MESSNTEIHRRATVLLTVHSSVENREILTLYLTALSLRADIVVGREVFKKQCAKCHRLRDQGHAVGPDLAASKNRVNETLMRDITNPSDPITVGYRTYTVINAARKIFTGILAAETATSVTLRKEEGVEQTILRNDMDSIQSSNRSLMPDGLEKIIFSEDAANLIAYLREVLGPSEQTTTTVFDDDESFVDLLDEDKGTLTITTNDRFSGTVALVVKLPQRYVSEISGWKFCIRENPGLDEFRYLRFA